MGSCTRALRAWWRRPLLLPRFVGETLTLGLGITAVALWCIGLQVTLRKPPTGNPYAAYSNVASLYIIGAIAAALATMCLLVSPSFQALGYGFRTNLLVPNATVGVSRVETVFTVGGRVLEAEAFETVFLQSTLRKYVVASTVFLACSAASGSLQDAVDVPSNTGCLPNYDCFYSEGPSLKALKPINCSDPTADHPLTCYRFHGVDMIGAFGVAAGVFLFLRTFVMVATEVWYVGVIHYPRCTTVGFVLSGLAVQGCGVGVAATTTVGISAVSLFVCMFLLLLAVYVANAWAPLPATAATAATAPAQPRHTEKTPLIV